MYVRMNICMYVCVCVSVSCTLSEIEVCVYQLLRDSRPHVTFK